VCSSGDASARREHTEDWRVEHRSVRSARRSDRGRRRGYGCEAFSATPVPARPRPLQRPKVARLLTALVTGTYERCALCRLDESRRSGRPGDRRGTRVRLTLRTLLPPLHGGKGRALRLGSVAVFCRSYSHFRHKRGAGTVENRCPRSAFIRCHRRPLRPIRIRLTPCLTPHSVGHFVYLEKCAEDDHQYKENSKGEFDVLHALVARPRTVQKFSALRADHPHSKARGHRGGFRAWVAPLGQFTSLHTAAEPLGSSDGAAASVTGNHPPGLKGRRLQCNF